jgi:hypothetical protein
MDNIFETFNFFSQTIIGFSLLVGVMLLYRFLFTKRMEQRRERKKYTLELCLSDPRVYENILSDKRTPYYKQIENDEYLFALDKVNEALSYFEKLSIGMLTNVYDEIVIRLYYEKYFLVFYDFYKYYILKYRERNDLPFLYIEYEKYVKRWMQDPKNVDNLRRNRDEW